MLSSRDSSRFLESDFIFARLHRFKLGDICLCFGQHYFEARRAKPSRIRERGARVGDVEAFFTLDDRSSAAHARTLFPGSRNNRATGRAIDQRRSFIL